MNLYLNFERLLASAEVDELRELVRRRGLREPLQQIVGSASFCGLEIAVNRNVLVPRPETELLAECGWQFLALAAARTEGTAPTALDFGTGSGCIAIALAAKTPGAKITALDISADALAIAQTNAAKHALSDRIEFAQGDNFAALPGNPAFDLIISNPPYIPAAEIEALQPEVRDFEPRTALEGGLDGLDYYRRFAAEAPRFLKAGGRLMVELGDRQEMAARKIFEEANWVVEEIREDYTRRPRILIARL